VACFDHIILQVSINTMHQSWPAGLSSALYVVVHILLANLLRCDKSLMDGANM